MDDEGAVPGIDAVCPQCRFVLFEEDLDAAALARLRPYVDTPVYQAFARERSSHYLMAKLMLVLHRDELSLAHVYLQASWQEEGDATKLRDDLELSLRHFEAYLRQRPAGRTAPDTGVQEDEADPGSYQTVQILKGEVLRRLGRFGEAAAHLKRLQEIAEIRDKDMVEIIAYELLLCQRRDSEPHTLDELPSASRDAEADGE